MSITCRDMNALLENCISAPPWPQHHKHGIPSIASCIGSRNNVLYRNSDISACGPRKSVIALSDDALVPADRPIREMA